MLFSAPEKKELLFPLHLCPRSRELVWMQGELPCLCQLSYNKLQSSYLGFQLLFQTLADKILTNQCIYGWVSMRTRCLTGTGQPILLKKHQLTVAFEQRWLAVANSVCQDIAGLSEYKKITFTKSKEWLQGFILLQQWSASSANTLQRQQSALFCISEDA